MPQLSAVTEQSQQATSIRYNTMVYEMQAAGRDVLVMSLGEAFFDIPLFAVDDLPYPDLYHYSHSRGLPELRRKLMAHYAGYHVRLDWETEIIVTAGSKAAIYMALLAIINPGDEVLFAEPAWVSYPEQIKLCHGIPRGIPFPANVADYERHITGRTKAIVVTNPHNPRGYVFGREELGQILDLARKYDLWVLSDEAYSDFVQDGSFVSMAQFDPDKRHAVVFNSLSKNLGMSGWRLGYVVANPSLIANILKVNQHLITCAPSVLQHYVARHFEAILEITKPQIAALAYRREKIARYMDTIGLRYASGGATFYFFVSISPSRLDSESFCIRLLNEQHVCVVPGLGYGASCDGFVRVSIGAASLEENMRGLDRIKELIEASS